MKYLELKVLITQIKDVFLKYNKQTPRIEVLKFKTHITLVVDEWEIYLDKKGDYYMFNNIIDTHHNEDVVLQKIKAHILCDLINNNPIAY